MQSQTFHLDTLLEQRKESKKPWLEFLRVASLRVGVYHVAAHTDDLATHAPHAEDEVYYVLSGRGRLRAETSEYDLAPGSIAFVAAGTPHYFSEVGEDLHLLVFFGTGVKTTS